MSGNPGPLPRLEDWVIIWHSEIAGLIADPETTETALRLLDLWAEGARRLARAYDRAAGDAAVPPARPAAPAAAPDGGAPGERAPDERDRLIARLLERVDELERRLDELAPSGNA